MMLAALRGLLYIQMGVICRHLRAACIHLFPFLDLNNEGILFVSDLIGSIWVHFYRKGAQVLASSLAKWRINPPSTITLAKSFLFSLFFIRLLFSLVLFFLFSFFSFTDKLWLVLLSIIPFQLYTNKF